MVCVLLYYVCARARLCALVGVRQRVAHDRLTVDTDRTAVSAICGMKHAARDQRGPATKSAAAYHSGAATLTLLQNDAAVRCAQAVHVRAR